jgi:hypothetical protein
MSHRVGEKNQTLIKEALFNTILSNTPIKITMTCKNCPNTWSFVLPVCEHYALNYKYIIPSGEKCVFDIIGLNDNLTLAFGLRFKRTHKCYQVLKCVEVSWFELGFRGVSNALHKAKTSGVLELVNLYPYCKCSINCLSNKEIGTHLGFISRNRDITSKFTMYKEVFSLTGFNNFGHEVELKLWQTFLTRKRCLKCHTGNIDLNVNEPYCEECKNTISKSPNSTANVFNFKPESVKYITRQDTK